MIWLYLLTVTACYATLMDLAGNAKEKLVTVFFSLIWPLWIPIVAVVIFLALFTELG